MTVEDSFKENQVFQSLRKVRTLDVTQILTDIKQLDIIQLRPTPRYYPLRFFADGVEAYRWGFDNAVIYYCGTALEIALLSMLRDIINHEQSAKPQN